MHVLNKYDVRSFAVTTDNLGLYRSDRLLGALLSTPDGYRDALVVDDDLRRPPIVYRRNPGGL